MTLVVRSFQAPACRSNCPGAVSGAWIFLVSRVLGVLLYSTLFVVPNRTGRHLGPVPVDAGSRL